MVTWNDFEKIWASTSPLTPYEFSDPNYSQGWNFVGSTPPARQMWDSIQKKNDEKFKYLRDNFGTPNIATSSSQMTDTEKVYVYMGSEAGRNSGHWYYYDEGTSSWADGGVYNSVAFVTDTTLSIAGQPADAKAVGDALALKADLAGCTFTGNVNVSADLSVTGTSTLAGDVTASSDLSVAGDSALTNLSVSGTTALAGTSTAPTPSADDNSTKIATTEYVQTEIKPIETDVTINDKRITNIEKLLQGNLYDYQTDSTSAYTKSVPSGAMPYAGLESLGGKTVVWNQLVNSGATTVATISGHKYYTLINGTANIVTSSGSAITIVDDTADMVTDLTLCYGAGNEPTTVAEFKAMFPADYYPYNAGTLLSAGVTSVVSKDSNDDALQKLSIPAEVKALDGYGWSAGTAYNYIDYERKVFVKNVRRLDLGTMNWFMQTPAVGNYFQANGITPKMSNNLLNAICPLYTAVYPGTIIGADTNKVVAIANSTYSSIFRIRDTSYTDVDAFKTAMNGVYLYYELATPIETDISAYLTDNLVEVGAGGTLTFENSNGDDYHIPVPSTETYMINLQEAVSNG